MQNLDVSQLVSCGAIGVACLALLVLTYLQYSALKQSPSLPRRKNLHAYLLVAGGLVFAGAGLQFYSVAVGNEPSPGALISEDAAKSFAAGNAVKLEGKWFSHWFVDGGDGPRRYAPNGRPYGCEEIVMHAKAGRIEAQARYQDGGTNVTYWFGGRLSSQSDLTLTYWKPENMPEITGAVGVVFLHLAEALGNTRLVGYWRGRTRTGSYTHGPVLLHRQCLFDDHKDEEILAAMQPDLLGLH